MHKFRKLKLILALTLLPLSLPLVVANNYNGIANTAFAGESVQDKLQLDINNYKDKSVYLDQKKINYRAYENIPYVGNPVCPDYQKLSIYIPETYLHGGTINSYNAKTAPIFMPNNVGGYMPGDISDPAQPDRRSNKPSTALQALARGYVVVSPAIRGRSNIANGKYVGKAPALIVDYKAAVRYLRHNKNLLPAGNTERIISSGTSAGGALSSLLGATGNSKDYEPYLSRLGAAKECDDVFASQCYCPITNLEHADMAYEWIFNGVNTYYQGIHMPMMKSEKAKRPTEALQNRPLNAPMETAKATEMTQLAQTMSSELKVLFPAYVNSLNLKDSKGQTLQLNAVGNGTFKEYIESVYMASAQKALAQGQDLGNATEWLTIKDGKVIAMDLTKYAAWATRMKETPAFDKIDYSSGENDEFATEDNTPRHFTDYSLVNTVGTGIMADPLTIKMLNPMNYIGAKHVTVAKHWRIRHGAKDRDTSLAIPALLALKLQNHGYNVDFASPWGQGHGGDYDLDELFDWIDRICKGK